MHQHPELAAAVDPQPQPLRDCRGLSLVELLLVLAIAAVLLGGGLPSFRQAMDQRRVEAAAAQLRTDIQLARTEAQTHNRTMRLSLHSGSFGSCYLVHTGAAADCSCHGGGRAICSRGAELLRSEYFADSGAVQVRSNSPSMVFEPSRGTVTPTATVRIEDRSQRLLHAVVNLTGRSRLCTPNASMPGYKAC